MPVYDTSWNYCSQKNSRRTPTSKRYSKAPSHRTVAQTRCLIPAKPSCASHARQLAGLARRSAAYCAAYAHNLPACPLPAKSMTTCGDDAAGIMMVRSCGLEWSRVDRCSFGKDAVESLFDFMVATAARMCLCLGRHCWVCT